MLTTTSVILERSSASSGIPGGNVAVSPLIFSSEKTHDSVGFACVSHPSPRCRRVQ